MSFNDEKSFEKAWNSATFGHSTIVDDTGRSFNVDMFYGYSFEEGEAVKRKLGYLFDQLKL